MSTLTAVAAAVLSVCVSVGSGGGSSTGGAVAAPVITGNPALGGSWDYGDLTKQTVVSTKVTAIAGSDGTTVTLAAGNGGPISTVINGQQTAQFTGPLAGASYMQAANDCGLTAAAQGTIVVIAEFNNSSTTGDYELAEVGLPSGAYSDNRLRLGYGAGVGGISAIRSNGAFQQATMASPLYSGTGPRCMVGVYGNGTALGLYAEGDAAAIAGPTGAFPTGMTTTTIGGSQESSSAVSNTVPAYITRVLIYRVALTNAQVQQVQAWAWLNYNTYGKAIQAKTISSPVIAASAYVAGQPLAFTPGQDIGYPIPTDTYNVRKNGTLVLTAVSAATAAAYSSTVNGDLCYIEQTPTNANGSAGTVSSVAVKIGSTAFIPYTTGPGIYGQPMTVFVPGILEASLTISSYQWYKNINSKNNLTGQLPYSTAAHPTADAVGAYYSCRVTLSDGTVYATPEFGNTLPTSTFGVALSIAQQSNPYPGTATRPSGNTGNGYFTRYGALYDPNGVLFMMRGTNVNHYDDGFMQGTNIETSISTAAFNIVRWFCATDNWNTNSNGNQYIMASAIAKKIVPMPAIPSVNALIVGTISGGNLLTVSSVTAPGVVCPGAAVYVTAGGAQVGNLALTNLGTGTGGTGTYTMVAGATNGSAGQTSAGTTGSSDPQVLAAAVQLIINMKTNWQAAGSDKYAIINIANEWGPSSVPGGLTGTISGTVLTVTSNNQFIVPGNSYTGSGVTKFKINPYGSGGTTGTGNTGTYQITVSQTVASSTAMDNVTWRDEYITAITNLRTAGFLNCFAIDTGGSGQDQYGAINHGAAILAADPQHNVIFMPHMYGAACQSNTAISYIKPLYDASVANGLCFGIGEFGPGQNVGPSPCSAEPGELIQGADSCYTGFIAWAADDHATGSPPDVKQGGFGGFVYWETDTYAGGDPAQLTYWYQKLIMADPYRGTKFSAVQTTVT
jgi:hypothetical protein